MASLNPLTRELVFKLVFYGPGLGGKTTSLYHIHEATEAENRGNLVSLATPTDRTIYFDFLPIRLARVRDLGVRLQLFTVPGQVYYSATRKLVLTGVDAIVFVADSQGPRMEANVESLEDLERNLHEHGRELATFPLVFQWNKRDLPEAIEVAELERRLNPRGCPSFESTATSGEGVFEALEAATKLAINAYLAELPVVKEAAPVGVLDAASDSAASAQEAEGGIRSVIRSALEATTRAVTVPPLGASSGDGLSAPIVITGVPSTVLGGESSYAPSNAPAASPSQAPSTRTGRPVVPKIELGESASLVSMVSQATIANRPRPTAPSLPDPRAGTEPSVHPTQAPSKLARGEAPAASAQAASEIQNGHRSLTPLAMRAVTAPGFSFAELFAAAERPSVRKLEDFLASGDVSAALDACDDLVSRRLAAGTAATGYAEAPRDPAMACMLLGVDGRRFLKFRMLVRGVRQGGEATLHDAMEYYLFLLEVRSATDLMR